MKQMDTPMREAAIDMTPPGSERHDGTRADHVFERWQLLAGDVVIADAIERADRMLTRMRGLLGRAGLDAQGGLWIDPCPSIHMFFMRFAIDAVFVDRDLRIVRIHHDIQPWRMARGGRGARSVLELPAGSVAANGLAVGDQLELRRGWSNADRRATDP